MSIENENGTIYNRVGETPSGVFVSLRDLTDTDIQNPQTGEIIVYDVETGMWSNQGQPITGAQTLDELNDVDAGSPNDNQVLTYDAATQKWNAEDPQGAAPSIGMDDLTDVDSAAAVNLDTLMYDGANWGPKPYLAPVRSAFNPAAVTFERNKIHNTYNVTTATSIVFSATGGVDGMIITVPIYSDGSSVITWGTQFRDLGDHTATLPTVLPLGVNTVIMQYDATLGLVLVEIVTQRFKSNGQYPMTGNMDMNGFNINNCNQVNAEFIRREPFTGPTSGAFIPDFGERSDFFHGVLTAALTIGNPTNQEIGQEGVIFFDNSGGFVTDSVAMLGTNFKIMSDRSTVIPAKKIMIPYKVWSPATIFYSVEYA